MAPIHLAARQINANYPFGMVAHVTDSIVVLAVFLSLAWIAVSLRFWTRIRLVKVFAHDDTLMAITLLFYTAYAGLGLFETHLVNGKDSLTLAEMETALNVLIAHESFYILCMMTLKVTLALLFLRIMIEPWQRRTIMVVVTVYTIFSVGYFFFCIFQCGAPINALTFLERRITNQCISRAQIAGMAYGYSALTTLTDVTYVLLPLFIVKDSGLCKREKIIVYCILAVAGISSIASVVRLVYVRELAIITPDFFAKTPFLMIWSVSELGIGIIAGCLVTLRKLFTQLHGQFSTVGRRLMYAKFSSNSGDKTSERSDSANRSPSLRNNRGKISPTSFHESEVHFVNVDGKTFEIKAYSKKLAFNAV